MGLLPEAGEELHFTHSAPSWAQAALLQGPLAKQKPEENLPFPSKVIRAREVHREQHLCVVRGHGGELCSAGL